MRYFDHDTTARKDDRILALRMEMGGAAVDAYWAIIEAMCEEQRPFPSDCDDYQYKVMASQLFTDTDTLCAYVQKMVELGLLESDGQTIVSNRARSNWEAYEAKSKKAKESIAKRWNKKRNTDEVRTYNEGNSKEKEKEKEKEGRTIKGSTPPKADNGAADEDAAPVCPECGNPMRLDWNGNNVSRYWCSECQAEMVMHNVLA